MFFHIIFESFLQFVATYESSAVDAECRFEVGRFVEVVFEALAHRMTVCSDEVWRHFRFANHAVPVQQQQYLDVLY